MVPINHLKITDADINNKSLQNFNLMGKDRENMIIKDNCEKYQELCNLPDRCEYQERKEKVISECFEIYNHLVLQQVCVIIFMAIITILLLV